MTVVDLWTVQIVRDDDALVPDVGLAAPMAEMEENLTDLMPEGYRARIRRWNQPDEGNDDE